MNLFDIAEELVTKKEPIVIMVDSLSMVMEEQGIEYPVVTTFKPIELPVHFDPVAAPIVLKSDYKKGDHTAFTYYGQFVSHEIIQTVVKIIGAEAIMKSTKPHFTDIRQETWDNMSGHIHLLIDKNQIKDAGEDIATMCFHVCVAKAAARIYREAHGTTK